MTENQKMTERAELATKSKVIVDFADIKLFENRHKDNKFKEMSHEDLILDCRVEVNEVDDLLYRWKHRLEDDDPITEAEFRVELLRELGDVHNYLRFIAARFGCLE